MKTRRYCPYCGRPVLKSCRGDHKFECYKCCEDFLPIEVLRKKDEKELNWIRRRAHTREIYREKLYVSFKKPFPRFNSPDMEYRKTHPRKFNLESLRKINPSFDWEHGLDISDLHKVNDHVRHIERTRSSTIPKVGDRIIISNKYGDYYRYGHIDGVDHNEQEVNICENGSSFIWKTEDGIGCSTSGGSFSYLPLSDIQYVGKEDKTFWFWGNRGACGNGGIYFQAEVSVWEYKCPDPLYGEFTTRDWVKMYIYETSAESRERERSPYHFLGNCIAWRNKAELDAHIELHKGKLFHNHGNSYVLFCYREQDHFITQQEYDALDLPVVEKLFNGDTLPMKYRYDDEKHIVHFHFVREASYYQFESR